VILSGVVCVAMLALGFNSLLPLGGGLETVCVLIAVASAMSLSALWMAHSGTVETPVEKSLAVREMPVRTP
jgi:hypothetical protein